MKIYHEGNFLADLSKTRNGGRLVGINIAQNDERIIVEPIYLRPIKINRDGQIVYIDIAWNNPLFTIILMMQRPFVYVMKPVNVSWEEE